MSYQPVNITNFPTNRPPLATDDNTKGYASGHFWNYGGRIWQCKNAATGVAVWENLLVSTDYMLDIVPNALLACAVFKLRSAYVGDCFVVTRASDSATLSIGFDSAGFADWKTVDIFLAGTTGNITTWYDQSGNGNDLTQSAASAPVSIGASVNGIRAISFDSIGFTQYLHNSSVVVTNWSNSTTCLLSRLQLSNFNSGLYQIGDAVERINLLTLTGQGIASTGSNTVTSTEQLQVNPQFLVDIIVTTGRTIYQNNQVSSAVESDGSATATGIVLSNAIANTVPCPQDALAFIVYNTALSTANVNLLQQSAYTISGIQPQACDIFCYVGDSLMAGKLVNSVTPMETMFMVALPNAIQHPFRFYNIGVSGAVTSSISGYATTFAPLIFRSGVNNIVCVEGGTNDLANSSATTPASVYANLKTICATFKSAGFQKVCLSTVLPRNALFSGGQTGAGFETARLALNVLIRAGQGVDYDVLVDMGGDPTIGVEATYCTATYSIDNVHPNVLGHAFEGAVYQRSLAPIL